MIRLSIILISFLLAFDSRAQDQDPEIDSLNNVLKELKVDSLKINILNNIGMLYLDSDINAAIRYGIQSLAYSKTIQFKKGEANASKLLGIAYSQQGNFPQADEQFKAALELFEDLQDKAGISSTYNNLGNLSHTKGDDSQSIEYYLKSLKIAEEIDNKLRIGTSLLNIGVIYSANPDHKEKVKAIGYFRRALPIFQEINDINGIGTTSVNIGEDYYNKKMYDSALVYFKASIRAYEGTADAAFALSYVGDIFAERKNFDSAFIYHKQSIDLSEKFGAQQFLAQSLISFAKTQQKKGDIKNSIASYERALQLSTEIDARPEIKMAYEGLAAGYASIGDFQNAYIFGTKLTTLKDTLYNSDEAKKIQQLQFNFENEKKESTIALQSATIERQQIVNYAAGVTGFLLLILAFGSYQRYKFIRKTNKIIKDERDRSKELLLNILPEETARELETNGSAQSRYYESATVLFTDFKGFSTIAGKLSPQQLVAELNDYFIAFDEIMGKYNLEKIKTIGDAYMCAGGIPITNNTHPLDAVKAGLAMQDYMTKKNDSRKEKNLECWELRIGIHTGPIVAGVVGKKKYAYDIWGDTVNIASRMESNGEPGKVNISASTYQHIKEYYQCLYRGKISAKNIGDVDMYFIESSITRPSLVMHNHFTA